MKQRWLLPAVMLCASSVFAGDWKPPVQLAYGEKDGIYLLTYASTTESPVFEDKIDAALSLPYINGVSHYQEWRTLEPSEGIFDWRQLDAVFELAKKHGKYVIIGLQAGVMAPEWVLDRVQTVEIVHNNPGWTKGATIQTPAKAGTKDVVLSRMPVPWCPAYQSQVEKVIKAIADRYDGDPSIAYVGVNGPSASAGVEANFNVNWDLTQQAAPETVGALAITAEKYVGAWKASIDAHLRHFKKSNLGIGLHDKSLGSHVCRDGGMVACTDFERMKAAREIRDYFLQQHAAQKSTKGVIRNCGLSESLNWWGDPDRTDDKPASDFTALQWEVRDTGLIGYEFGIAMAVQNRPPKDFARAVHNGLTGYGRYLEIKVPDIVSNKPPYGPYEPYRPVLEEAARIMQHKSSDTACGTSR